MRTLRLCLYTTLVWCGTFAGVVLLLVVAPHLLGLAFAAALAWYEKEK